MNRVMPEDIANICFGNNVQISEDGKHIAFVKTVPDRKESIYKNDIYLFDTEIKKTSQLTFNGKNGSYHWDSNDTLLIETERVKEDEPEEFEEKTVFYRLNIHGGEAKRAFSIDKNVQDYLKVKEGLYAIKALVDWNKPDPKVVDKDLCKEELDYHIFEEVPVWGDGRGFVSGKRTVLFLYDETTGDLLRITGKYVNVSGWTVKNGKIAYIYREYDDVIPSKSCLAVYDSELHENRILIGPDELKVTNVQFTEDSLVFMGSDLETWGNNKLDHLYRFDFEKNMYSEVFKNEEEISIADTPMTDCFYGGGKKFVAHGSNVFFTALKGYRNGLYVLEASNTVRKIMDFNSGINCFDTDGTHFAVIGAEKDSLNRFYYGCDSLSAVYEFNPGYLENHYIAEAEYIPFTNSDGYQIDGWVLKPIDFDSTKKYPGLLEIHGGPRATYGDMFFHEMQQYASQGYFVFFCNPRGSEGYGEEFADLRGKYGTIDYHDLMEFTDHVLATVPNIDSERIGALGGSYGGFMCNWIEGHTDRFKAIASQRSVSNWVADFGASEIGVTFDSNEMGATPWTDMQKMWNQSPLKFADQAKTPILFINSREDYNCPMDQGIEMFTAMRYHHVPSRLVLFEKESHGLSRIGKPRHRIRRLKEMNDWFAKYIGFEEE